VTVAAAPRHRDILTQIRWLQRGQSAVIASVPVRRVWGGSGWYSVADRPPRPGSEAADLILKMLEERPAAGPGR
jgi:hypothetical protein